MYEKLSNPLVFLLANKLKRFFTGDRNNSVENACLRNVLHQKTNAKYWRTNKTNELIMDLPSKVLWPQLLIRSIVFIVGTECTSGYRGNQALCILMSSEMAKQQVNAGCSKLTRDTNSQANYDGQHVFLESQSINTQTSTIQSTPITSWRLNLGRNYLPNQQQSNKPINVITQEAQK